MRRRTLAIIATVLALGVLPLAASACNQAEKSDGTKLGPIPTAAIEWDLPHMTIADWTRDSDLIVAGAVVKVDEPRWNSADGKRWSPHGWDDDSEALVYQTFYVGVEEALKGSPQWEGPVAFRAWWNSASGSGPVNVGDMVVAFGELSPGRYGAQGVYQPAEAYWLTSEGNSLWLKQGRAYENQGIVKDKVERLLTLDELESRVREAGGPGTTARTQPPLESAEAGWGETVTFAGILQITATPPLQDLSGKPAASGGPRQVVLYSTVTLENIGTLPRSYDPLWFGLEAGSEGWSGGQEGVQTSIGPPLVAGTLRPGETVTGTVPFQLSAPAASQPCTLMFDTVPVSGSEQPVLSVEWR
jgi:hypothetical protein